MSFFHNATYGAILMTAVAATSAQAEDKNYDFENFHSIKVAENIDLTVVSGARSYGVEAQAAGISGVSRLKISQDGPLLVIDRKNRWSPMMGLLDGELRVTVELPELVALSVQAGSAAEVSGRLAQDVAFDVTSGSHLEVAGSDAKTLAIGISAGSKMSIDGRCDQAKIIASSGAELDASALRCKDVRVTATSGADIDTTATERVQANASSGGDISVHGGPAVTDVTQTIGGAVRING
ncbi:GIN domain-containing protein [Phaeobacter sp. B1627]|uniref:GIN domain-containing protein n=1 Tax=Phaeobacter sp. B1627 TaxID=2583809 RepID=UPI0011194CE2|nr:DUF2807 domain-containing protein [Phaeobacter sp. B1627]TNJ46754.1 DUF2807 domain-containing protein [Phaeobacter sp. B1627]